MILTIIQVNSPSTSVINSLSPPLVILNSVGSRKISGYENHTVESIKNSAPNMTENVSSSILNRVMIVHCECVMAIFMMKQTIKPRPFEIGVSKTCCWPCTVFLEELSRIEDLSISISSTHSKTYGGWKFPSSFAHHQPIYDKMVVGIENRISDFLWSTEAQRRSDSQYVSSGDEVDKELDLELGNLMERSRHFKS